MQYKVYKQLFDEVSESGLRKAIKSPGKRGWSAMTRQSIPSANDVIRDTNMKLSLIAQQCAQEHKDSPSLIEAEETETLIG